MIPEHEFEPANYERNRRIRSLGLGGLALATFAATKDTQAFDVGMGLVRHVYEGLTDMSARVLN